MPKGRPPKDPTKLAKYLELKAKEQAGKVTAIDLNKSLVYAETNETDDDRVLRIQSQFDIMETCARGATTGAVRSLIVSGAGGVGKTHSIERILEYAREQDGTKSEVVHGVITPVNLYKLLYRNRHANNVVVLDDADSIFEEDTALSILKAALDSNPKRKISWLAQGKSLMGKTGEGDTPTDFIYEGTMIFITNLDFQKFVDANKGRHVPHMQALMTRAIYLDLKLHTVKDLTAWIRFIVNKAHILEADGLSKAQQQEILDYIQENQNNLRNLSIRTALKLASFVKMVGTDWKEMAKHTELR